MISLSSDQGRHRDSTPRSLVGVHCLDPTRPVESGPPIPPGPSRPAQSGRPGRRSPPSPAFPAHPAQPARATGAWHRTPPRTCFHSFGTPMMQQEDISNISISALHGRLLDLLDEQTKQYSFYDAEDRPFGRTAGHRGSGRGGAGYSGRRQGRGKRRRRKEESRQLAAHAYKRQELRLGKKEAAMRRKKKPTNRSAHAIQRPFTQHHRERPQHWTRRDGGQRSYSRKGRQNEMSFPVKSPLNQNAARTASRRVKKDVVTKNGRGGTSRRGRGLHKGRGTQRAVTAAGSPATGVLHSTAPPVQLPECKPAKTPPGETEPASRREEVKRPATTVSRARIAEMSRPPAKKLEALEKYQASIARDNRPARGKTSSSARQLSKRTLDWIKRSSKPKSASVRTLKDYESQQQVGHGRGFKSLSKEQVQWIERASKPKRKTDPFKSPEAGGFGLSGSRFPRDSKYNAIPGPGAYGSPSSPDLKVNGGKISKAKTKSDLDWTIWRAKTTPGPSDYGAPDLPRATGVRISEARPKSELDWQILRALNTPGPGQYGSPDMPRSGGVKWRDSEPVSELDRIITLSGSTPGPGQYSNAHKGLEACSGGRFNKSKTPDMTALAVRKSRDVPGPGAYNTAQDHRLKPSPGGSFNIYAPASDLDLTIKRAKETPGPGAYAKIDPPLHTPYKVKLL